MWTVKIGELAMREIDDLPVPLKAKLGFILSGFSLMASKVSNPARFAR